VIPCAVPLQETGGNTMIESLDLSVPVGGSGMFIQLHLNGALQKVQPLWTKYCRLQKRLDGVHASLGLCNDAAWLFEFAKKCQRQEKEFERELRRVVDGLEKSKALLEKQCEKLHSHLQAIDPSLVHTAHSLSGARVPYGHKESSFAKGKSGIDVLKRNWVIENNPGLSSRELCKRFDVENIPIPLKWSEEFPGVDSWSSAYGNDVCKKRIHKMISEARRELRLP
jgi:hypothetical protein